MNQIYHEKPKQGIRNENEALQSGMKCMKQNNTWVSKCSMKNQKALGTEMSKTN